MRQLTTYSFLLCLLVSNKINAQTYHSLFERSDHWNELTGNLGWVLTDSITWEGEDTLINGINYQILKHSAIINQIEKSYVREDTTQGKLWYLSDFDPIERLIADYSLALGDSFYIEQACWQVPGYYFVDSVWYEQGYKNLRVVADLCWPGYGEKLIFMEGLGTNIGFGYQNDFLNVNPYLICAFKNGQQVFGTQNPIMGNQFTYGVPGAVENLESLPFKTFPNPCGDYFTVHVEVGQYPISYKIINILGMVLHSGQLVIGDNYIDLNNVPKGSYWAEFTMSGKRHYSYVVKI